MQEEKLRKIKKIRKRGNLREKLRKRKIVSKRNGESMKK